MPVNAERAGSVAQSVKAWTIATGSSTRAVSGCRSSAFTSDANARRPPLSTRKSGRYQPIAREEQLARLPIPHCKRELTIQAVEALGAPFLVGVGDDFRVAVRREAMTERAELRFAARGS